MALNKSKVSHIPIEEGKYYANDGEDTTTIMLVIPRKAWTPPTLYRTESLAVQGMQMWQNDWLREYFDREATQEEIEVFEHERMKYGESLPGIGEMVVGMKFN